MLSPAIYVCFFWQLVLVAKKNSTSRGGKKKPVLPIYKGHLLGLSFHLELVGAHAVGNATQKVSLSHGYSQYVAMH